MSDIIAIPYEDRCFGIGVNRDLIRDGNPWPLVVVIPVKTGIQTLLVDVIPMTMGIQAGWGMKA